jgi:leucyl aminopeptidase
MREQLRLKAIFLNEIDAGFLPTNLRLAGFTGALGQANVLTIDDINYIYVGLGARQYFSSEILRIAINSLARFNFGESEINIDECTDHLSDLIAIGTSSNVITTILHTQHPDLQVVQYSSNYMNSDESAEVIVSQSVRLAMTVTNNSGTHMNPIEFAKTVEDICHAQPELICEIISGESLVDRGYPAVARMGAGSPFPAHFIHIRYRSHSESQPVVLVGKGVTFDTGGLSIKSSTAMAGMRHDICGAATVLATMKAIAQLHCPTPVTALLPVIENMIGPDSIRPGDDIHTRAGHSMRIIDTDFEGRVILADGLTRACELNPRLVIDFSTLTYQSVTALGPDIGAYFSNSHWATNLLDHASKAAGEAFWQLPLAYTYDSQIRTNAGLKNHPEADTGRAITAALLLREFVSPEIPWIHIDATGPTWKGQASSDGATGFGVHTLVHLLMNIESD